MKTHSTVFFLMLFLGTLSSFAAISDAKLKERLTDGLLRYMVKKQFFSEPIKDEYDPFSHELKEVTDAQFHRVLMEIYNEAEEKWLALTPNTPEWEDNKDKVIGVLVCLPLCGDIPVKEFLLEYAASKNNDSFNRTIAVLSYLRTADAKETSDALLRFLVGRDRFDFQERSSVIAHATEVFRDARHDKKRAIVESLAVALANEDAKWLFRLYDGFLAQNSSLYADSFERRNILQNLIHATPTCKADELALPDLEVRWCALQKRDAVANINTNLAALKGRDFGQPLVEAEFTPRDVAPEVAADGRRSDLRRAVCFGGLALVATVFVLLRLRHRMRGK